MANGTLFDRVMLERVGAWALAVFTVGTSPISERIFDAYLRPCSSKNGWLCTRPSRYPTECRNLSATTCRLLSVMPQKSP